MAHSHEDEDYCFAYNSSEAEPWRKEALLAAFDRLIEMQIAHTIRGEQEDCGSLDPVGMKRDPATAHKSPTWQPLKSAGNEPVLSEEEQIERDDSIRRSGLRLLAVNQIKVAQRIFLKVAPAKVPIEFLVAADQIFKDLLLAQTNFFFYNESHLPPEEKAAVQNDMKTFAMALNALQSDKTPMALCTVFPFNEDELFMFIKEGE